MAAQLDSEQTIQLPSPAKENIEAKTRELIDEIRRLKDKVARWQRQLEEDRRLLHQAKVELAKFRQQAK